MASRSLASGIALRPEIKASYLMCVRVLIGGVDGVS